MYPGPGLIQIHGHPTTHDSGTDDRKTLFPGHGPNLDRPRKSESTLKPGTTYHSGHVEAMHRDDLLEKLRKFLEVHAKAKILSTEPGTLTMYVLHSKTQDKTTKQKMINYKNHLYGIDKVVKKKGAKRAKAKTMEPKDHP